MTQRYAVFAWLKYEPAGGLNDLVSVYDNMTDATMAYEKPKHRALTEPVCVQMVDLNARPFKVLKAEVYDERPKAR